MYQPFCRKQESGGLSDLIKADPSVKKRKTYVKTVKQVGYGKKKKSINKNKQSVSKSNTDKICNSYALRNSKYV